MPRLYLAQDITSYGYPGDKPEYNFFKFYAKMLGSGLFVMKISWLWFLIALFIDSIIVYPLLKWS